MRLLLLQVISLWLTIPARGQSGITNDIYKKITDHYKNNPKDIEIIFNTHKNALRYDTIQSTLYYVALPDGKYFIFRKDSSQKIKNGLLLTDDYYLLNSTNPEKIRLKKRELKGTIHSNLKYVSPWNCKSLFKMMSRFGKIETLTDKDTYFLIRTKKSLLEVDKLTYRIISLTEIARYKDKIQYDKYEYLRLSDSAASDMWHEIQIMADASKYLPVTTFREIQKNKLPPENPEGTTFFFKDLFAFNTGPIDSLMRGKYVIFDFFYQACLPCHKMTNYILNWLPTVDSSRIMLVGINPTDSEEAMKLYVKKRGINYPIIVGQQAKLIAQKYVSGVYPTLLLIAPNGIIKSLHTGMSKSFLTKTEKFISN